jgi:hypothetical protein
MFPNNCAEKFKFMRPVFCNSFMFTVKQNVLLEWI